MAGENGRYVRLSLPRKWIADLMHFSRRVPAVGGERVLRVRAAADARRAGGLAVGWNTMIVKALAVVSERIPELRRAYIPFPWPRLYEAPYSVASVILDREYEGEHATFMAPVLYPERVALPDLQAKLDKLKTAPVRDVGPFRRLIRTTKWPLPVRRLLWSIGMYGSGLFRARTFGTFAVNSVAGYRSRILTMRTPITSCFYYGTVSRDGELPMQMVFDHRVFDGYTAGHVMSELEQVLNGEVAAEVASLAGPRRAAA